MGFELRSFQRQFHSLMDTMKPQIRPRFVVWLDERLAEFKVKGQMDLSESLDDPQWIKTYVISKREAKEAAIKKREAREGSGSAVQPKLEAKSESSNGLPHDFPEEGKIEKEGRIESERKPEESHQDYQLVEVKEEQVDDDNDSDMIIVGETPSEDATESISYPSQFNPNRQMYSGFSKNYGPFQRKRRFGGAIPQRPMINVSGTRIKSRRKPMFHSSMSSHDPSHFQSHSITSQSMYTSVSSTQYSASPAVFPGDTQGPYEPSTEQSDSYIDPSAYGSETLRLPSHLQSQDLEGYAGAEGGMYADYGDESYDSSYLADTSDTSLLYDEQGNAVIKGESTAEGSSMEPIPGTSDGTSQDVLSKPNPGRISPFISSAMWEEWIIKGPDALFICTRCNKTFTTKHSARRHVKFYHLNSAKFCCHMCSKLFMTKANLDGHINSFHLNIRPFVCVCSRAFCYRHHLVSHAKTCLDAYRAVSLGLQLQNIPPHIFSQLRSDSTQASLVTSLPSSSNPLSVSTPRHNDPQLAPPSSMSTFNPQSLPLSTMDLINPPSVVLRMSTAAQRAYMIKSLSSPPHSQSVSSTPDVLPSQTSPLPSVSPVKCSSKHVTERPVTLSSELRTDSPERSPPSLTTEISPDLLPTTKQDSV